MKALVFDIEANGLLSEDEEEDVSEIHCISTKDVDTGECISIFQDTLYKESIQELLCGAKDTFLIGHNILRYDLEVIKKLYNVDILNLLGERQIIDTYLWSKVLWPDRPMPKGCPTSVKNPITGKSKKIGPHGLEAWGYRVGNRKIEIHDWRFFDSGMLSRCEGDVEINLLTYFKLLEEIGLEHSQYIKSQGEQG